MPAKPSSASQVVLVPCVPGTTRRVMRRTTSPAAIPTSADGISPRPREQRCQLTGVELVSPEYDQRLRGDRGGDPGEEPEAVCVLPRRPA